jgi:hypothetical protein
MTEELFIYPLDELKAVVIESSRRVKYLEAEKHFDGKLIKERYQELLELNRLVRGRPDEYCGGGLIDVKTVISQTLRKNRLFELKKRIIHKISE